MSGYSFMALMMFSSMLIMLLTGRHIFAVIGSVASIFAVMLWGIGGVGMAFQAAFKLLVWYPLLTLPIFIYIGYMFAKSGIADDLYELIHVWMGPVPGGLAIGTILLMCIVSAINGLSVAGMAVGSSIALPEMLKRKYDKTDGHRSHSGRQFAGNHDTAERRAGALRHDSQATGRAALARRIRARIPPGRAVHRIYPHQVRHQSEARARPCRRKNARCRCGRSSCCSAPASFPCSSSS